MPTNRYEHLQNTWSRWNCIAWSKSALLLELSWLLYFLLYFAPLAKSLGDKKVPNNEKDIAKVFGKDTTNQGHECLKKYVQTRVEAKIVCNQTKGRCVRRCVSTRSSPKTLHCPISFSSQRLSLKLDLV